MNEPIATIKLDDGGYANLFETGTIMFVVENVADGIILVSKNDFVKIVEARREHFALCKKNNGNEPFRTQYLDKACGDWKLEDPFCFHCKARPTCPIFDAHRPELMRTFRRLAAEGFSATPEEIKDAKKDEQYLKEHVLPKHHETSSPTPTHAQDRESPAESTLRPRKRQQEIEEEIERVINALETIGIPTKRVTFKISMEDFWSYCPSKTRDSRGFYPNLLIRGYRVFPDPLPNGIIQVCLPSTNLSEFPKRTCTRQRWGASAITPRMIRTQKLLNNLHRQVLKNMIKQGSQIGLAKFQRQIPEEKTVFEFGLEDGGVAYLRDNGTWDIYEADIGDGMTIITQKDFASMIEGNQKFQKIKETNA